MVPIHAGTENSTAPSHHVLSEGSYWSLLGKLRLFWVGISGIDSRRWCIVQSGSVVLIVFERLVLAQATG